MGIIKCVLISFIYSTNKNFYKKYNINIKDVFDVSKLNENKYYFYIPKKYLFVENYILCDFILD